MEWTDYDEKNIIKLMYSSEWFLKTSHQEVARQAYCAILDLKNELEDEKHRSQVLQKTIDSLKKTVENKDDLLVKMKESNYQTSKDEQELEIVNAALNKTIDNYDASAAVLEKQIEALDKKYNEEKEKYDNLISTLRVLLPEEN